MRLRSVALLAVALALAPRPASAQSAPSGGAASQETAAQLRFAKGRELFMAQKYADALVEFRAASELFASPNTRYYIARCERELGHPARAYLEFQRAASEAADRAHSDPKYTTTRDNARQEAQALEAKIGRLVVRLKDIASANVIVGGAPLGAAALGIATPTDPGPIEIAATAKGRLPFKKVVTVKAGEQTEVTVALEPDPNATEAPVEPATPSGAAPPGETVAQTTSPPPEGVSEVERRGGGLRVAGLFVMGAGVAGFIGVAVFGAVAQSQFDQLSALRTTCGKPGNAACPTQAAVNAKIDDGSRNQTIANVALGVGIGGLVIGGLMVAVGGPTTVTRTRSSSLRPTFGLSPAGGFAGVEGAF